MVSASHKARLSIAKVGTIGVAVAFVSYAVVVFNIKPALAARSIINGLTISAAHEPAGRIDALIEELKKGEGYSTFGTTEIREQANQIGNAQLQDQAIAGQDKQKYLKFVIEEMEKQRKEEPTDVRAMAFIANAYSTAGRYQDAINAIDDALKISTRRQQFYFVAAEAYLGLNNPGKAVETLKTAYELDPAYDEAVHNYVIVLLLLKRTNEAENIYEKRFGSKDLAQPRYAAIYARNGDFNGALRTWRKLLEGYPKNAEYHAGLGGLYFQMGNKRDAIAEFQKAIEFEPRFKERGEEIIKQIEASK